MRPELTLSEACRIRVFLHGPLLVQKRMLDGEWKPLQWKQGRLPRAMFRRLLVAQGRQVSRLELADDLWAESEEGMDGNGIAWTISLLRASLGGSLGKELINTYETGYQVAGQDLVWVDLDAADMLLREAENQGYITAFALPLLEEAFSYLSRGVYLEGEIGQWRYGFQEKSERLFKRCCLWLAENYEAREKYWQASERYRALLQILLPGEKETQEIQAKLNRLTEQKLGLKTYMTTNGSNPLPPVGGSKSVPPVVSNGLFRIGGFTGAWMPLDGDGTVEYRRENIRTHYISQTEELPEELQERKRRVEQEQKDRKEQGLPFAWNGAIYNLDRFVIGREPVHEEMTLDLWFSPGDYYTFLATNKSLDDPALRAKYLQDPNWYEPIPFFSHSFGVALVVVTADDYCLLTQRSAYQAIQANIYSAAAVVESLSRPIDRKTDSFAPDLYRCACRGLAEELGLIEQVDFFSRDIVFLNFGVNTTHALWAFRGMVRVQRTCQEVLDKWSKGVKDKLENQKLFSLPFTPKEYIRFITEHKIVGESLYYALVHEFGRTAVEQATLSS